MLLSACSGRPAGREERDDWEASRMLDLSSRVHKEAQSTHPTVSKKQATLVMASGTRQYQGVACFPGKCMTSGTCEPGLQIADGTRMWDIYYNNMDSCPPLFVSFTSVFST